MNPKYLSVALLLSTQVNWSNDLFSGSANGKKELIDQHVDGTFLDQFVGDFGNTGIPPQEMFAKLEDLANQTTTKTWADVNQKLFDALAFAFAKNAKQYAPPPCPKNVNLVIDAINSLPQLAPESPRK